MGIDSKITLGWNDQEYKIKMTASVIMGLEDLGIHKLNQENISLMRAAVLVSFLLSEAGAKDATEKDVYGSLYGLGDTSPKAVAELVSMIQIAITPELKKKPITRSRKPAKKKPKK